MNKNIISLFSGAGGMDLGFERAGFKTIWANEFDKKIVPSYINHFKGAKVDNRSLTEVEAKDLPKNIVGVIGGPPCQSWSAAGAKRGIKDKRGQLFYDYLRVIKLTNPQFFVAENVSGILHKRNLKTFSKLINEFKGLGYTLAYKEINASDYQVPQDRHRVLIIGYRKDLDKQFEFPPPILPKLTLRDSILDLRNKKMGINSHEVTLSTYSPIFLSRNRVRGWDKQSFTILATDRHIPFHPDCPPMIKIGKDKMSLQEGGKYRRLSIRECARIQTFPDEYKFLYTNLRDGYKMVGNAVPVNLAFHIARKIRSDLFK
jgi:DNA (cytosine-5)-methyltransferase 1